ncbi:MAG: lipid A export permease/ATP-binding protein MsbA [Alphaproteobacteria bacterium]|nr:lipid A export permease/ATP-binding protein MsbA [Alphaproteobacteria bacterium]
MNSPDTQIVATQHNPATTQSLVSRLVREYVRPHRGRLSLAVLCMAVVAGTTAANAYLMKPVFDDVFILKDEKMLLIIPIAILFIAVIKGAATYGQAVLMSYIGQKIVATIQNGMFSHLMWADIAYFQKTATGKLISRFNNDANMLRAAVSNVLVGIAKDTLTLIFLVALLFYHDWALALIAFVVFPTAVYPIVRIGQRMRKVSDNTQVQMGELTTILDETFRGARHVRAYGMEKYEIDRAGRIIETIFQLVQKAARVRSATHPIMESLGGVAIAVIIFYGGSQVVAGATTPGTFASFISALLMAYPAMKNLANLNANLQEGLAAAQRIFTLIDAAPTIQDKPDAKQLEAARGDVKFENVRFGYEKNRAALSGINLDIPAGSTVALVGPSGAGKSTVLNLIPRFYDSDDGQVLIDGKNLRDVTVASLRANIALVSQDITLFDDTVRSNIAYGKLDASDDEIIAAATAAEAHEFISGLTSGYETHVGGRGLKLSGGQRQRIAIARAMLKNAPILLLDEATSALDTETERQVQSALETLTEGRTTIVIAHRLSTVMAADNIYVMDNGQIVEQGTHAELLAKDGAYARLYAVQFAEQAEGVKPAEVTA